MNYLNGDLEKIKIFDRAFTAMSLSEIRDIFGSDAVVEKLKNIGDPTGPLIQAAHELSKLRSEVDLLKNDITMLRSDVQALIRCLSKGMGDQSAYNDFYNLKMRHNIY
jgi:hypothetical protein